MLVQLYYNRYAYMNMENSALFRQTTRTPIRDFKSNYLKASAVRDLLQPPPSEPEIKAPRKISKKKRERIRTINSSATRFKEWYIENYEDIKQAFDELIGIYTTRRVVFTRTHAEIYSDFAHMCYRRQHTRI